MLKEVSESNDKRIIHRVSKCLPTRNDSGWVLWNQMLRQSLGCNVFTRDQYMWKEGGRGITGLREQSLCNVGLASATGRELWSGQSHPTSLRQCVQAAPRRVWPWMIWVTLKVLEAICWLHWPKLRNKSFLLRNRVMWWSKRILITKKNCTFTEWRNITHTTLGVDQH